MPTRSIRSRQLLAYLNTDAYQVGLVKAGLWGVSHQTLLTLKALSSGRTQGHRKTAASESDYKFITGMWCQAVWALKTNTCWLRGWKSGLALPKMFSRSDSAVNQTSRMSRQGLNVFGP
jgi:hypothetical protein